MPTKSVPSPQPDSPHSPHTDGRPADVRHHKARHPDTRRQHVLITGGGTGIGASTAHAFARTGAAVTLIGRRPDPIGQVADAIGGLAIACDARDAGAMRDAVARARAQFGPVTVAIANAGTAHSQPFAKMTPADLDDAVAANLTTTFTLWRAVLDDMKAAHWGRLIAIASVFGEQGGRYVAAYCAAKHGVVGMTRALAVELAHTGITVNAVCPGFVDTPLTDHSIANITEKTGMTTRDAARVLLDSAGQTRFIRPEEVAAACLYLASPAGQSVNGHMVRLTGDETSDNVPGSDLAQEWHE